MSRARAVCDDFGVKPFSLLVKPASADCNLRCEYCFYLGKCALYPNTARHRMPREVLETMIRTFLATDQPVYGFGWQGGEPTLMGLDFFRAVTDLQQRHGRPGAQVSNGLQTNATLLDDAWAQHLARCNFLVGVSIDGPEAVHNRYRVHADGRGAHAAVMAGLDALLRNRVEYNVLTLVSRANVDRPVETYRYLCDLGVLFHQYIECVEFAADGRRAPFAVGGREWGDFLCAIFDAWHPHDTRRVSVRLFDSVVAKLVDGVANACTLGRDCRQYLVVEHNGDVYPCDFYVDPEWKLGNVMEQTWEEMLASPRYEAFGRRKREWDAACEGCEYLSVCAGDCPKNRSPHGGDHRRLSALCEGWKRFYDHAMPGFERLAQEIRREREEARREQQRAVAAVHAGRVGRNDPCPCGSGRKFKRCCGAAV